MSEDEVFVVRDFVVQCNALEQYILSYPFFSVMSSRVKAAVLLDMVARGCVEQEDPKAALEQSIFTLKELTKKYLK